MNDLKSVINKFAKARLFELCNAFAQADPKQPTIDDSKRFLELFNRIKKYFSFRVQHWMQHKAN